jgi:hypothetical protein
MKVFIILSLMLLLLCLDVTVLPAVATANATATIQTGISASMDTLSTTGGNLAFGKIVPSEAGGTVVVNPTTGDRANGNGSSLSLVSSIAGPASFNVTGSPLATFAIALPVSEVMISDGDGHTMIVKDFVSDSAVSTPLSLDGKASFKVGGTLVVGFNQSIGVYTGAFNVTVAYN